MVGGALSWQRCVALGQDSDYNNEVRAISGRVTSIHSIEGFEAPSDKGQTLHPPGV